MKPILNVQILEHGDTCAIVAEPLVPPTHENLRLMVDGLTTAAISLIRVSELRISEFEIRSWTHPGFVELIDLARDIGN